ncbi:MAG: cupin domain-containing protein [Desulfobacterales bacterium]|nr:cupin domain-containing protein [Desulfobacterales bacterium]
MIRKLFVAMLIMVMAACHHSVKKDAQLTTVANPGKSTGCMEPNCPASECINPAKGCIEETETNKDGFLKGQVKCNKCEPNRKDVYMQTPTEPPFFTHEDKLEKKINKAYPEWYRGCAPGFKADACSHHFYYILLGPERFLESTEKEHAYNAENLFCGTFTMRPGKTYPAHVHPSREMYYVIAGEADWYAGDEVRKVKPGSFMVHPPFTPHGWTVTSEEELKTFYCWWREDRDDPKSFDNGGRFANPCINEDGNSAKPDAVPLDQCK